jgi:plastocyanin
MKYVIGLIVVIALIGGVYYFLQTETVPTEETDDSMTEESDNAMNADNSMMEETADTTVISYTDEGFSPREITVAEGDTVVFVNNSSRAVWPASAQHPTHTVYLGSDIQKCNTAEAGGLFDACGSVAIGDSWSFTFTEAGTWKYHDHLRASLNGTIIVQ